MERAAAATGAVAQRDRLFLFKGAAAVSSAVEQHGQAYAQGVLRAPWPAKVLPRVYPPRRAVVASTASTGDLRRTRSVANHAHLATTVRYVETPQVQAQHRARIAALQSAFIGHIEQTYTSTVATDSASSNGASASIPPGEVVSMFGFGCTDPLAGTAPGTRRGELCTNFMGCFTCPNAIITPDPSTLARLLQARAHLRAAATSLHPARWQAFYAPQLRILEEDILPRFAASELALAQPLDGTASALAGPAMRHRHARLRIPVRPDQARDVADHASVDRAWFLRDSTWHDPVWVFKPTNALEEATPVRLRWNFTFPDGGRFTDDRYAPLLESSRQLIALIRRRSLEHGPAAARQHGGRLLPVPAAPALLDEPGGLHPLCRSRRAGAVAVPALAHATPRASLELRSPPRRCRSTCTCSPTFTAFATTSTMGCASIPSPDAATARSPACTTPRSGAGLIRLTVLPLPLVQGAIDLVTNGAADILQARQVYATAMALTSRRGCGVDACTNAATRALQEAAAGQPGESRCHSHGR